MSRLGYLWQNPGFFGVKPELVTKGGYQAWGARGEGNASISRSEPASDARLSGRRLAGPLEAEARR